MTDTSLEHLLHPQFITFFGFLLSLCEEFSFFPQLFLFLPFFVFLALAGFFLALFLFGGKSLLFLVRLLLFGCKTFLFFLCLP
jgi:hypothetical protein